MLFAKLSEYFEKLENTSSRLSLIDILSELFKQIKSYEEIEKVCYLVQGRIAPFFEATEIGMAEKTVAEAIGRAYSKSKDEVLKLYGKIGDMGKVVENLDDRKWKIENGNLKIEDRKSIHNQSSTVKNLSSTFNHLSSKKDQGLSIEDVFKILTEIANTKGNGTVDKRLTLLSDLLKKLDPISAKHLVRIPLGNMRLGIGDPTILDALAKAKFGDKGNRKILEGAYNRTSDLGLIAKTLWSASSLDDALKKIEKLKVQVGKPIRSELCERLPNPAKVIEKMIEVDVQYKYDGFRVQIHKNGQNVSMFSRNLENMTHMFPELIEATLKQVKAKTVILDTEALAYNPDSEEFLPFQETTKRRRKHNIAETAKKLPLKAFVFDILYKDGQSLIDESLTKRLAILKKTILADDILIPTKTETVTDPKRLQILLDDAISKGLEGLVVKKLESPYVAGGRNFNWVKLKRHSAGELKDTIDCVILGYVFGKGKRTAFGAGALLVGVYDKEKDMFVTVSKIGTGLTDEEWQSIKQKTKGLERKTKPARVNSNITPSVWVEPAIVIEILADEITRSPIHTAGATNNSEQTTANKEPGYALRFPRLVSFRDKDKRAEDCTSVKELIGMYKDQGHN